ncbi:N-acylglucosamine 2-epimerase [Vibrio navarrensis]|nr:N-acylglucosamine 2-epimerase [Vibrio navarrensis]
MKKNKWLKRTCLSAVLGMGAVIVHASAASLSLPDGEQWLAHAKQGLAPYWMMPSARGEPEGNFPTFRCDDGQLLDVKRVCAELNYGWITPHFGREYTRMKSRQTYAYGVLFHLTGDPEALKLARQGAKYLIEELQDKEHGGFISFTQEGKAGLEWQQRTSQDQAYALVGLAMLYYLTRDAQIESVLIQQQRFIFDKYRLPDGKGLAWVLEDGDEQSAKQRELVAQLDQINGYLLLVAPLLPEPHQSRWLEDLNWLTQVMLSHYYSAEEQRFYGAIHHKAVMMQSAKHNDFGHTIKAYWMTYLSGQKLGNAAWQTLARQGMQHTLQQAQYAPNWADIAPWVPPVLQAKWKGQQVLSWRSRPGNNGISSWEWAELDQAAMTLALLDGNVPEVLYYTLPSYMQIWVDPRFGGVGLNPQSTKAFHWGNAYHQFEHALVGYLFSQQMSKKPVTLYYAMDKAQAEHLAPYYFNADVQQVESLPNAAGLPRIKVQFTSLKP